MHISFTGNAAVPGVWLILTRITHCGQSLYHVSQTGMPKLGHAMSPLDSLTRQLHSDVYLYTLARHLESNAWPIQQCEFHMCGLGPLEKREDCANLPFIDLCRIALLAADLTTYHLDARCLTFTQRKYRVGKYQPPDKNIAILGERIFVEFIESAESFLQKK